IPSQQMSCDANQLRLVLTCLFAFNDLNFLEIRAGERIRKITNGLFIRSRSSRADLKMKKKNSLTFVESFGGPSSVVSSRLAFIHTLLRIDMINGSDRDMTLRSAVQLR
ncbi:uncharacterized, partial [Tachysurus ichikawai]